MTDVPAISDTDRLSRLNWPFPTPLGPMPRADAPPVAVLRPERAANTARDKRLASLDAAFDAFGIADGQVLSFHHHYRNGDRLVVEVCEVARRRGLRGLVLACSSLFPVHAPLVPLIEAGVIAHIITDYAKGPVADAAMAGALAGPLVLQTHGGRARAICAGQLEIDVAFVGASVARADGAATGRAGALPCGPLGYARVDAGYARRVVVVAHEVTEAALPHVCLPAGLVDAVVKMTFPGQPEGILSGSTVPADTPAARAIAAHVAGVVEASGMLRPDVSMQAGAGGVSLAAITLLGKRMVEAGLRGSFLSGGIAEAHVAMLRAGLFEEILDVQCFDRAAVASSIANPAHRMMSAARYASPLDPAAVVNALDIVLLGAVEVDEAFNVNVTLGGDGRLIGGPGGHPDTAEGAKLVVITTQLTGGGYAKLVREVAAVTTPGRFVDVIVTDRGIAVSQRRPDLASRLVAARLPVRSFEDLRVQAEAEAGRARTLSDGAVRVVIEGRHGGVLDVA